MPDTPIQGPPPGFTPGATPQAPTGPVERKHPYGKPWIWVAGVGLFLVLLLGYGTFAMLHTTKGERVLENCTVTDKGAQHRVDYHELTYLVHTDNCGVLSISDSALHQANARKRIYESIDIGRSYTFTVVGRPLGDVYPSIIEVTETG